MGRTVSMGTMYANLPFFPFFHTTTKRQYPCGWMVNGQHVERYRALDVTLAILPANRTAVCLSCGRAILGGELYGNPDNHFVGHYHCADCVNLPDGVEVWELTYTQRKSRRHPNGEVNELIVHYPTKVEEYQRELTAALMRPVNARKVSAISAKM